MVRIRVYSRGDGLYDVKRTEFGPHEGFPRAVTTIVELEPPAVEEILQTLTTSPSGPKFERAYNDVDVFGWNIASRQT